ncbi:MAG: malonyl-ACP O-methyltransferase BioC [Gammaproteobacteria bacterium]
MTHPENGNKKRIRQHFGARAECYESSAILQREVCTRMLDRLDWVKLKPEIVLDVGAGTGWGAQGLLQKYSSARVLAMDLSLPMMQQTRKKSRWFRKPGLICGDAEALPLADQSIDLIFSSLMLQWCDPQTVFNEFLRVLKPGGLLMFATFGPDTLKELRHCWAQLDQAQHVNSFIDMHDLGDSLLHSGFAEPVMDMDMMSLTYQDARTVMSDLKAIGANTPMQGEYKGLLTPRKLQRVLDAYEAFRQQGVLPASFEVIYGHGWKPLGPAQKSQSTRADVNEYRVSLDSLKKADK